MTIDIFCAGLSSGEPPRCWGGCGFVLSFVDDNGRVQQREFHYGLGLSDQQLADCQAIRLALAAVVPAYRGAKTTLHVASPAVADALLEPVESIDKPMAEARRWYGYYKNIQIVVHGDPMGHLRRALELAELGLSTQKEFDSLTTRKS